MFRTGEGIRRSAGGSASSSILNQGISEACAWRRDEIASGSWLMPLSGPVRNELDALATQLATYQGRIEDLRPENFTIPGTVAMMADVKRELEDGKGFMVLDCLPVERWGDTTSKAVSWLLTALTGAVVMQKQDGTRLYEVKDSRKPMGYGVRRSVTNLRQDFHTDGGWLGLAPETMSLACLRPAQAGGTSRVVSLATVHNILRQEQPALLSRLYEDFWWDRQAEHSPEEPRCSRHPVFSWNGRRLTARCYSDYIYNGHRMMEEPLDSAGQAALAAMQAVLDRPEIALEFRLESGQIEFINNHLLAHSRTAFKDHDGPRPGRLMLRLWTRNGSEVGLEGVAQAAND